MSRQTEFFATHSPLTACKAVSRPAIGRAMFVQCQDPSILESQWALPDSNQRPPACEAGAKHPHYHRFGELLGKSSLICGKSALDFTELMNPYM